MRLFPREDGRGPCLGTEDPRFRVEAVLGFGVRVPELRESVECVNLLEGAGDLVTRLKVAL